jgi:ATP-dependent RNA helicase RhlB
MFDMGFYPDLRKLIGAVPPADRRQTMLFSATLNAWVKNLAWEYTKNPFEIEIEPETVTVEEVEQVLYHVPSEEKMKLLLGILEREKPESAIIFCNTKRYTEIIAKRLRINGYDCEFIIGDMPQSRRLKVIEDVKAGKIKYLAATDVAARGLDIEGLALVVNYDLPSESENSVHRIGRTARAGKTGRAITLVSEQDVYELPAIERYIGKKIPSEIAMPVLHAGDKSEGMRIQTDFYDDPREERRIRGGARGREAAPRRSEHRGERRGDRVPRDRAAAGRGREAGGRRGRHHSQEAGGAAGPGKAPDRAEARGSGQTDSPNLSSLSFDERMAYYKQKYEARPERGKGRRNKRQDKPRGEHRGGTGARQNAGDARTQAREPERRPSREQASAPEKKGILSRLMGIFKKKDS